MAFVRERSVLYCLLEGKDMLYHHPKAEAEETAYTKKQFIFWEALDRHDEERGEILSLRLSLFFKETCKLLIP